MKQHVSEKQTDKQFSIHFAFNNIKLENVTFNPFVLYCARFILSDLFYSEMFITFNNVTDLELSLTNTYIVMSSSSFKTMFLIIIVISIKAQNMVLWVIRGLSLF